MKSIVATVVVAVLAIGATGCSKFSHKKILAPEEVGKSLATVLCEKHAACQQNPDFNKDQCIQEISTGLAERLKANTDSKIESAMLDACVKSITGGSCDLLASESPPAGCEFLK